MRATQNRIGLGMLQTGNPPRGTLHFSMEISLHGEVRNKKWWPYLVLKRSLEEWLKVFVSVVINGTIKKYENKEKHKIYVETLVGKNHG